jgi:anti-sigma factor RsiW
MSACNNERLIKPWLDGELEPSAATRIETHVGSCAVCRETAGDYRRISERLSVLAHEPCPEPDTAAILARAERDAGDEGRLVHTMKRVALLAASVLIVALGILSMPSHSPASAEVSGDELIAVALSEPGPGPEEDF